MKFFYLFMTVLLIFSILTSCSSSNTPDGITGSGKFIYCMESGEKMDFNTSSGMPAVIDPVNYSVRPLCSDPLCMHDSDECPFYNCNGCAADGGIMFFRRGWLTRNETGFEGSEILCTYDPADGKISVIDSYQGSIIYAGISKDVFYYYIAEFSTGADGLSCVYKLHKADGRTGAVTELQTDEEYKTVGGYTSSNDYPTIISVVDNCIYWRRYNEALKTEYYMTDTDNQNRQTIDLGGISFQNCSKDRAYYVSGVSELIDPSAGRTPDNLLNTYSLNCISLSDGTQETTAEKLTTPAYIITDRYIFVMDGTPETGNTDMRQHGCRITRMEHDGSNAAAAAETDQYDFSYNLFSGEGVFIGYCEDDENTYIAMSNLTSDGTRGILILDTADGTFNICE